LNGLLENVNPSSNIVTYVPNEDYSGEDSFTSTVNDGNNNSDPATVSITVEPNLQEDDDENVDNEEIKDGDSDENAEKDDDDDTDEN
jgi:hypothetical protein